ncbi:MAG: restriction endonuclease subunit S [Pseudomonadota bacterium]|uniref:restriction endonuclease subunit S n=1 Tax=Methylophaga aminisulfidivorans TaxID=230105 RepID=UPI0024E23B7B|nr:restriction endonuclease subunit S [Methylophaga aminisulfidivorans]MEC9412805.1 restriction endonuclease subunit S [Pseudomonadota bacterium]
MKWIDTTVGEYCPFVYGKSLPQRNRENGNVPVYGSNGIVDYHNTPHVKGCGIIIGRKGSVGAIHLSKGEFWPIDTSFYIEKDSIEELYFAYYLLKSLGLEHMNSDSAVPGLNRDNAHALAIRIPENSDDRKLLGSWISKFDEKIELNTQASQTLEQIAQALFKSWFVDFDPVKAKIEALAAGGSADDTELAAMSVISAKTLDELNSLKASNPGAFNKLAQTAALFPAAMQDSELGEIPVGWEVKLSGEIMDVRDGTHDSPRRSEVGYPLVTSKHITTGVLALKDAYLISEEDYLKINKRSNVSQGDILLTMIGTVGIAYLVSQNKVDFAIKNVGLFRTSEMPLIRSYFFMLLKSEQMQSYLDARMAGTTQKYLSLKALRTLEVLVPPDEILTEFNWHANSVLESIFSNVTESEALSNLRDALLPELLAGKLI